MKNNITKNANLIVIKIGSSLLIGSDEKINSPWLESLIADIALLKKQGKKIIIVTSGAVAIGRDKILNGKNRPLRLEEKQAAAACGQLNLMDSYRKLLKKYNIETAQILLTIDDTEDRRRYLNAEDTIFTLLNVGIIPIINENDSVATAELRFGDNDRLAARVAQMMCADTLILLSDIDGLYDKNPSKYTNAKHIPIVKKIDNKIENMGEGAASTTGSGGMITKIAAAKIAASAGCHTIISSGKINNPIKFLNEGAKYTIFQSDKTPASAKKQWIAHNLKTKGIIQIDAGAVNALRNGKSLLPAGVIKVSGDFVRGEAVSISDENNNELARGLIAYSSDDANLIIGKKTNEIEKILNFSGRTEMIHRSDMSLT